jgi:hypothetical protein
MSHRTATGLVAFSVAALLADISSGVRAQPRGASTIEAVPSSLGYDYVVHVRNTYDYKYNPQVRQDRIVLAKRIVRPFYARNQIVGEAVFDTEIFGLVTGGLNYVLYVKCLT